VSSVKGANITFSVADVTLNVNHAGRVASLAFAGVALAVLLVRGAGKTAPSVPLAGSAGIV
jgi:hypothetical protein